MDEDFKIKFSVDLNEAEKEYNKFKDKVEKKDIIEIKPELGQTDREFKTLFGNIQSLSKRASKNLLWSREKQNEMKNFFSSVESKAYSTLKSIEEQYSKLSPELTFAQDNKMMLEAEFQDTTQLADDLQQKIQTELDRKGIQFGTQEDYNKLVYQYNKYKTMLGSYQAGAKGALARGDEADYQSWLRDIDTISNHLQGLEQQVNNFAIGETIVSIDPKNNALIAQLQAQYAEATTKASELQKELEKIDKTGIIGTKSQELEQLKSEYNNLRQDLSTNPLTTDAQSDVFKGITREVNNINSGLKKNGQQMRNNTKLGEFWQRTMQRMKFSIYSMLNPLNIMRKVWSGFKEQNEDVSNTFEMISKNLIKILAPVLKVVAEWMMKIAAYADTFLQGIQSSLGVSKPISLFDKSVLKETDKTVDKVQSLTAGFDELHLFKEDDSEKSFDEKYPTLEMPTIDSNWKNALTNFGKTAGSIIGWAMENPLLAAGAALGTLFLGKLLGKGISALAGKALSKIFGGSAVKDAATSGGSLLGSIFGKTLYTGMNGQAVTLAKFAGGLALVTGGLASAGTQAVRTGANWMDMTTTEKAVGIGLTGIGAAATGLGAVMLGASGPVGWAVAGVVALGAFTIGMAQTQDGIDSVKKETEKLAEVQDNAKTANDNYLTAMNNLSQTTSNLDTLQQQTGLSGAALAEQVKSGILTVDNMTNAQLQVYNAYLQNEEMIKQLKDATNAKVEADKQAVIQSLNVDAANAIESKSYDDLKNKVVQAWQEGSISAEEAGDILSRTMANADDETQKTFGESIPEAIKGAYNPDKYESGWRKFGNNFKSLMSDLGGWFEDKWKKLSNWWNGLWNKNTPSSSGDGSGGGFSGGNSVPSYDVGTNYVPNDQLAMVHKGEAIIPAKYNTSNNSQNNGASNAVLSTLSAELANLRSVIQQGISVNGEFVQRGNDLYATVEKAKSGRGAQPLSNNAYAR